MYQLDLADEEEKKLIEGIFSSAVDSLSEEDKRLPQVRYIGLTVNARSRLEALLKYIYV